MAKISEKYEAMMVFSISKGEDAAKALVEKFAELIKGSAELVSIDEWGKRRLAYAVNYESRYENDGYYVIYNFDCKPDFPRELERVVNITDGVLRSLVVLRK